MKAVDASGSVAAGVEDLRRELAPEIMKSLSVPLPPGYFRAVAVSGGHLVDVVPIPEDPGPTEG